MLGLVGFPGTRPQRLLRLLVRQCAGAAGTPVRRYAGTPVLRYAPSSPLQPHSAPEGQVGGVPPVGIEGRMLKHTAENRRKGAI